MPDDLWLHTRPTTIESIVPFAADAKVLALGDATHGTHEFFDVKRRLIPMLVREAAFNVIAFEASYAEFDKLREYVATGRGDPAVLIQSGDYFFWDAQEVLDVIEWARSENARGNRVDVAGVDCAHPHSSIDMVLEFLARVDPPARTEAATRYGCLNQYKSKPSNYNLVPSSIQQSCRASIALVTGAIESRRAQYGSDKEFERVLRAARVVEQGELSLTVFPQSRDACMAENIEWLSTPSAKIIVWGHNAHLGKTPYTTTGTFESTGSYLANKFGSAYKAIGTIALDGSFWAYNTSWIIEEQFMPPAHEDDYARFFDRAGAREMFIPFTAPLPPYLRTPHRIRIGASTAGTHEVIENLPERFDGMIYIDRSTPSRLRHFPRLQ